MRRFNPFNGMQVSLFDTSFWSAETATAIKQRINSDLYYPGVINGLTVFESGTEPGTVAVTPGVAYDINGERVAFSTLQDRIRYSGAKLSDAVAIYRIGLRYVEGNDGTSGLDVDGSSQFRHLLDSYSVVVLKTGADSAQSADVILSQAQVTVQGGTLIMDSSVKNTFSAKYAATGTDINQVDLHLGGSLITGGCITSLMGASFVSLFVGAGGSRVTGTACFFRNVVAMSNITITSGDFETQEAGKGQIMTSPDGTKRARIYLSNDGFLAQEPLNYEVS